MTSSATRISCGRRLAYRGRFTLEPGASRSIVLLFGVSLVLGGLLVAAPRAVPGIAVATVLGGAWLSLILAVTLPGPAERAGAELARRLAQFRHETNSVGDQPTRGQLDHLLERTRELELHDCEVEQELTHIRASIEGLDLARRIAADDLPVLADQGLAPGDTCHFSSPARCGRRRSDSFGHMMLTSGGVKFRGAVEVNVPWRQVADVQRAGRDVVIALHESNRVLRFSLQTMGEAVRCGVTAQHLAGSAGLRRQDDAPQA